MSAPISTLSIPYGASPALSQQATQPLSQELDCEKLLYSSTDDIFDRNGNLKTMGTCVSFLQAEKIAKERIAQFQLTEEQLHEAQIFHGAPSASLLAFTKYSKYEGNLLPVGLLEKSGLVPFSGEIIHGRDKVNSTALSTTWIHSLRFALDYTQTQGWSPEIGQKQMDAYEIPESVKQELKAGHFERLKATLDKTQKTYQATIQAINLFEITQMRMHQWGKLTAEEQSLVSNSFPVLYGIKSARAESHRGIESRIPGEIGLIGGAQKSEVKVIFTLSDKISYVKELLARNGHEKIPVEKLPEIKS